MGAIRSSRHGNNRQRRSSRVMSERGSCYHRTSRHEKGQDSQLASSLLACKFAKKYHAIVTVVTISELQIVHDVAGGLSWSAAQKNASENIHRPTYFFRLLASFLDVCNPAKFAQRRDERKTDGRIDGQTYEQTCVYISRDAIRWGCLSCVTT